MKLIVLLLVTLPWMAFATSPRNELEIINNSLEISKEAETEKMIIREINLQTKIAEELAKEVSANFSAKENYYLDVKNVVK